jgi:ABC-type transport system substrate-binding protein
VKAGDFGIFVQFLRFNASGEQGSLFHGDPPGSYNEMKWRNPEYDRIDDELSATFDLEERTKLQIELSNIVWDNVPVGIIRFFPTYVAYNSKIHNFYPSDFSGNTYWSLPYIWIDA